MATHASQNGDTVNAGSRIVVITPDHDHTIVAKYTGVNGASIDYADHLPSETIEFKVNRAIINGIKPFKLTPRTTENWFSHHDRFKKHLGLPRDEITELNLDSDFATLRGLEVVLRLFHSTLDEDCYKIDVAEFWYMVALCDYLNWDYGEINDFFAEWYQRNPPQLYVDTLATLMWPLWFFHHAAGFMKATRWLAYNCTGHISALNPTSMSHIRIRTHIIQQLNAAKGRLKTIFSRELWKPCKAILAANCACKEKTYFDFSKSLVNGRVWPIEERLRTASVSAILNQLEDYDWSPDQSSCYSCKGYCFPSLISEAVETTEDHFDGLCLYCIDAVLPKNSTRSDLIEDMLRYGYSANCRIKHGEATWWYSLHAREEDKLDIKKKLNRRRHEEEDLS